MRELHASAVESLACRIGSHTRAKPLLPIHNPPTFDLSSTPRLQGTRLRRPRLKARLDRAAAHLIRKAAVDTTAAKAVAYRRVAKGPLAEMLAGLLAL